MYDIGDRVLCTCNFKDAAGTNVDPTTIVAKLRTPAAVTTTYTFGVDAALTKLSVGNYQLQVDVTASGTWAYRFEGTGTYRGAAESSFEVVISRF